MARKIASRLPPRYRDASLADFSERISGLILEHLAKPTDGILIWGPVGTGKTHLAAAATRHILETRVNAVFERFAKFYADLRECVRRHLPEDSIFGPMVHAPWLVLDDLGAGSLSDHERRSTLELLDRRLNNLLPTVVTTNWSLTKISEAMDDRIASRLSVFTLIELTGPDVRVRK